MSSPVVETVRTIPLVIERGTSRNHIPMDIDDNSGFPFDRETDRDGHFRSQLDDIAKRHPELAEHLGSFSRRRQSSGGEAEDFPRRLDRPFAGHFERFGFPFDRDNFDPEQYAQQFYQQQPEFQHPQSQSHQQQPDYQQQSSYQPQYQPQPEYQQPQQSQPQYSPPESSQNPCTSEKDRNNIQQSNTIDLGQKQEPVNERNQRSMSAPPTEKGQRFTSSINIPVNQPTEEENMAQMQSGQTDGKTTERIIPIHIEGRDEPVLPKSASPNQSYSAGAQPERIFGHRPEHFTQFVNREPRQFDTWNRPGFEQKHQGFVPEDLQRQQKHPQQNVPPYYYQQQRSTPPQQPQQPVPPQPQPKHDIPIPVQRDVPLTKQQAPPQEQATPPQPKPAAPQQQKSNTPIDQIQAIQKDVSDLMAQVEQFAGKPKDKQYLYLDEMLTRNLLKLDNIDTQGQESIRSARKEAIKCIEKTISVLESKAADNAKGLKMEENMEVEEKPQEPSAENPESENKQQTEVQNMETEAAVPEVEQQPMEFSPENTNQESSLGENKNEEEHQNTESAKTAEPVTENRAVLVTSENKETSKVEDKVEPMEIKEEPPTAVATSEESKPTESCEGQEKNLAVAEALKKFEGIESEKKEEIKLDEDKKSTQIAEDKTKVEEGTEEKVGDHKEEKKVEDKKEKKKGKKKVEKKEK